MRALLDTNIIIHREGNKILNPDIGTLYKWLEKAHYIKCVHPKTVEEIEKNRNETTRETFGHKLKNYEVLKTTAPIANEVKAVASSIDEDLNDENDTLLLNEVFCERVDLFITEDNTIHEKAKLLGISEKVFNINSFLEKVVSEHPELIDYRVLSVRKKYFGDIRLDDPFFNSFKEDYPGFVKWFNKKSDETAYVSYNDKKILSFLYLKIEDQNENYSDISPRFLPKKRLKIGTFKVVSNGIKLGERFLKIIFDNAIQNNVEEIYVTVFNKNDEQKRLINLLEEWGFIQFGKKKNENVEELVYVRDFSPKFNTENPKSTYPYLSSQTNIFLVPIYPAYHTDLLPDSILKTESPENFAENQPHRNSISKAYISRSITRNVKRGDILVFYRTKEVDKPAHYSSVITTIGMVEEKIENIESESDFILKSRKRSIFTDDKLKEHWNYSPKKPFIINFLYISSFLTGKRINRKRLIELGIISGKDDELRGLKQITKEQFDLIIKETETNEGLIVN